jgi:hypothetical protein
MKMTLIRLGLTLALCLAAYRFAKVHVVEACAGGCSASATGSTGGSAVDAGTCNLFWTCRAASCNYVPLFCNQATCGTAPNTYACVQDCGGGGGGITSCGSDPSCNIGCSGWRAGTCG